MHTRIMDHFSMFSRGTPGLQLEDRVKLTKLYSRWLKDVWGGDLEAAREIFTADVVGHWPGHDVHGVRDLMDQVRQSHEMFSSISTTLDVGPVVDGDLLAARWTFRGDYRGGIPGATVPQGTRAVLVGHDLLRGDGDRFSEYWNMTDSLGLMKQLGVVQP